jgi:hypothetical protein
MDLVVNVPERREHLIRCLADCFCFAVLLLAFCRWFRRCSVHLLPGSSRSLFVRYVAMERLLSTSCTQASAEMVCATNSVLRSFVVNVSNTCA